MRRSLLTRAWIIVTALGGGSLPHSASAIRSRCTEVLGCTASSPRMACWLAEPSGTGTSPRQAASGPRTCNRKRAGGPVNGSARDLATWPTVVNTIADCLLAGLAAIVVIPVTVHSPAPRSSWPARTPGIHSETRLSSPRTAGTSRARPAAWPGRRGSTGIGHSELLEPSLSRSARLYPAHGQCWVVKGRPGAGTAHMVGPPAANRCLLPLTGSPRASSSAPRPARPPARVGGRPRATPGRSRAARPARRPGASRQRACAPPGRRSAPAAGPSRRSSAAPSGPAR